MKDQNSNYLEKRQKHIVVSAIVALLVGVAYYSFFRIQPAPLFTDPTGGTFPAFIHSIVLTLLAFAFTDVRQGIRIATALLAVSLLAEWKIGYADTADALMLVCGFIVAALCAGKYLQPVTKFYSPLKTAVTSGGLLLCSTFFIGGSYCTDGPCGFSDNYIDAEPVYMDYQTLRSAVKMTGPRPLEDVSRVYVYENTIFLNNKNTGIHVLDNQNPSNPINIAFIEIPGNTELSIRNNYLYADSYIDLVTLDISNPQQASEINRQIDIFPYDEYQNISDDIYFFNVDESKGVVISYERI